MNISKLSIIAILVVAILIGTVAAISLSYYFPTTGDIKTADLTFVWVSDNVPVITIDWMPVESGVPTSLEAIKITNVGSIPVTLALTTTEQSATITDLLLTWDYTGTVLAPSDSVTVILTQTIVATDSYSYKTVITATEAT